LHFRAIEGVVMFSKLKMAVLGLVAACGLMLGMPSMAALPAGSADVATTVITDIGTAAGLGATVLAAFLAAWIGFSLVKKFIKKGTS
jgi:hypothetical protein